MFIPAGDDQGALRIDFGGAATGWTGISLISRPDVAIGTPERMSGSTQVSFPNAGAVTYRPGGVSFTQPYSIGCTPVAPASVPVAATTQVS